MKLLQSGALLALSLIINGFAIAETIVPDRDNMQATPAMAGFGLVTADQREVEELSLRLMESEPVKSALEEIENAFRTDPNFELPGAAELAAEAARELVYRTVTYVVTEDSVRPKFLWTYNATRDSSGTRIPGTTYIESIDSIYRTLTLGKGYHYEITGRLPENPAAFITFEVWNSAQGLTPAVEYVTHLQASIEKLGHFVKADDDGNFVIHAGPEPANGRDNYLHVPEGGWLILRQSLSDWTTQAPIEELKVRLLDEIEQPAPTIDQLAARAAGVMRMSFDVYRTYLGRMFEEGGDKLYIAFGNKKNSLKSKVATRGGAWGAVTGTLYDIPADRAFVVTLEPVQARYFAMQLHDAWGRTLDPVYLTNRNNGVSASNPDGSFTYVLSEKDPGVANWLDTRGIQSGSLIIRWQGLDLPPYRGDQQIELVREAKLVSLAELAAALPKHTPMIDAAGRKKELALRKAAYDLRLR